MVRDKQTVGAGIGAIKQAQSNGSCLAVLIDFHGHAGGEYHHTNETPKKLKLDDFQTSVPTDIIGQHIHLGKFGVTSSDGSGNGFNYEDGTFAPDEVLERICKSRTAAGGSVASRPGETVSETVAAR